MASTQMKLEQIGDADRLARKLQSLRATRDQWLKVSLTNSLVSRRINHNSGSGLPILDDDKEMHIALVNAILKEYATRINIITNDLVQMGVQL